MALPDQMFYNTGISTYLWLISNRKEEQRKGKIQLINASGETFFVKMKKSLGNKRHQITEDQIAAITNLYGDFQESGHVKIFDNADFGYQRITVERPLRLNFKVDADRIEQVKSANAFQNLAASKKRKNVAAAEAEIRAGKTLQDDIITALQTLASNGTYTNRDAFTQELKAAFRQAGLKIPAPLFRAVLTGLSRRDDQADVCRDSSGSPEPDPELRDYENVPLKETIEDYMTREVLPHVPDAWVDESKTKIGYEINFNRYFYQYIPPRPLEEIEADLMQVEQEIAEMLKDLAE